MRKKSEKHSYFRNLSVDLSADASADAPAIINIRELWLVRLQTSLQTYLQPYVVTCKITKQLSHSLFLGRGMYLFGGGVTFYGSKVISLTTGGDVKV